LNLQALRRNLAREASEIIASKSMTWDDTTRITALINECYTCLSETPIMPCFCTNPFIGSALRNWEYMGEKHTREIGLDPFKVVSSQMRDACIMEDTGLFDNVSDILSSD
jgi:hypothetical protein